MTITPAQLSAHPCDGDVQTPYAERYQDVYHPPARAWSQAQEVFLAGNGLPERWAGRNRFVIVETGFGLGNNFLATWAAWQADPQRCDHLHFVSIEKHPLTPADLAGVHRLQDHGPSQALAQRLLEGWPPLTPGWHLVPLDRVDGPHGQTQHLTLLLGLGDVADLLPGLQASVDAFYLDGFNPRHNPEMWEPGLLSRLNRLAADGATAATWSAARAVRDALAQAHFEVRRRPGSGGKWHTLSATFAPRHAAPLAPGGRQPEAEPAQRHAIVLGAGLAGCGAAEALTRQGWRVTLVDAGTGPAQGASGNPGGLFHSIVHAEDGVHARAHRAAALATWARVRPWVASGELAGQCDGLLRLDPRQDDGGAGKLLSRHPWLNEHVRWLSAPEAEAACGLPVGSGGWLFHQAGWVEPPGWAQLMLQQAASHLGPRVGQGVAGPLLSTLWRARAKGLRQTEEGRWQVLGDNGVLAEAPTLVLATAWELPALLDTLPAQQAVAPMPISAVRGQVSLLGNTAQVRRPRLPVAGHGYALTLGDGRLLFGATTQHHDFDPSVRAADHWHNLEQAGRLGALPVNAASSDGIEGRVGWRATTPDRLPLVGALPWSIDRLTPAHTRREQVRMLPRERHARGGLFVIGGLGSRGLTWTALASELLAHWVTGSPCPVESELRDAMDPARFLARQHRTG